MYSISTGWSYRTAVVYLGVELSGEMLAEDEVGTSTYR